MYCDSTDAAGHRRRAAAWAFLRRLLRHELARAREDGEVWLASLLIAQVRGSLQRWKKLRIATLRFGTARQKNGP
jgi:hypothetical protein